MQSPSGYPVVDPPELRRQFGILDGMLVAIIGAFVAWVVVQPSNPTLVEVLDYLSFSVFGVLVGVLQFQVAQQCEARERMAWQALALSSWTRVVGGIVWSLWIVDHPGESRPLWLLALNASSLLLGAVGLLAFGRESRQDMDRRRQWIDGVIVLVGIVTALWFVALGPFFAATGAQVPRLEDYVYLLGDTTSVVVAALLVLSRSQRYLRHVASLLLVASLLQTVPDVLLWAGKANYSYQPGDAIAVLWFSVWVLKAAAARYALYVLRRPAVPGGRQQPETHYESGVVPTAFVILASVVLVLQLTTAPQQSKLPLVVSVSVLSMLLVARQLIEVQEQARVQRAQDEQAQWYGAVLRDSNDYVMVLDADGNNIDVSPAARRFVNVTDASSPWAMLSLVHPEDQHGFRQAVATARERPVSLAIRVADDTPGQWRQLALTIVDRRHDEEAGAVLLHAHDITRETQLSNRLRQTEEMEALGVFAGGLAHDLNNILTVVDAHAQMLEEDLRSNDTMKQDVVAIRHASERARRFTRGLLTLSRHKQAREVSITVEPMLRTRIGYAGLDQLVHLRCDDGLTPLYMDQSACHLAVDSLLLAVIEAEPVPQATATIELRAQEIRLDRVDAEVLHVDAGRFLLLSLSGLHDDTLADSRALTWDGSATQLALLLANAAVREVGGVQRTLEDGTVQTYLPMGGEQ